MIDNVLFWQWTLVIISSLLLFVFSPLATTTKNFFKASKKHKKPSAILLTGSLVISWIFAKSISNAANLGQEFGILGGVAYGGYYLSFIVAGFVIYQLRTQGKFKSIHHFLTTSFGKKAVLLFSMLIVIRLFNEVWSNTIVIGTFFGTPNSTGYYTAIIVFTLLTLSYSLKGGLSSSIFTDGIQMLLFSVLLVVILSMLFATDKISVATVATSSEWSMAMGGNLLFAALLQSLSYPFHDPVLTDRGFITSTKTTLKSFIWAGIIGFVCIVLFSVVGVFANVNAITGDAAVEVSKILGIFFLLLVNFIMITSAASTLDSTFSSFSKLASIDLKLGNTLKMGRITMLIIAVLGTIPVFFDATILSATTISGTMVIGLAPVFLLWKLNAPKSSFFLSVFTGLLFGVILIFEVFPKQFIFTSGKYSDLLWINIWGTLACFIVYLLPIWLRKQQI